MQSDFNKMFGSPSGYLKVRTELKGAFFKNVVHKGEREDLKKEGGKGKGIAVLIFARIYFTVTNRIFNLNPSTTSSFLLNSSTFLF